LVKERTNPRITLIQMRIKPGRKEKNLSNALDLIDENKDSDFIILPEEFLCGFKYSNTRVETIPGKVTELLYEKKLKNTA